LPRLVGVASAAFAFLNGAAAPEMIAAAIGAGIGQGFRTWLSRHHINQYGAAALSAVAASGIYVLAVALARHAGVGFLHYPSGFIASVLFLIPGFPLIAALFDLLRHQTVAAVSRFAYGVMILLAVALGLSLSSPLRTLISLANRRSNWRIRSSCCCEQLQASLRPARSQCCSTRPCARCSRRPFWPWCQ
jgi:hypothetical protein